MSAPWRYVTSNKPQRKGEVFIQRDGKFVLKVYAESVPNPTKFAAHLCDYLNTLDAALNTPPERFGEVARTGRPEVDDSIPF